MSTHNLYLTLNSPKSYIPRVLVILTIATKKVMKNLDNIGH